MGWAEHTMAILLAAAIGATPPGQGAPTRGFPQDVDPRLLEDLELIRMLDLLRDLDALRQMDEMVGPARADQKARRAGPGKAP